MNYASALLKDYFPPSENAEYMEDGYTTRVFLTEDYIRIMNIAIVLALVLSFCFVGILLLIGFTNVISTDVYKRQVHIGFVVIQQQKPHKTTVLLREIGEKHVHGTLFSCK